LNEDKLTESEKLEAVPLVIGSLSYRGVPTPDLICELQRIREESQEIQDSPSRLEYAIGEVDKIEKELTRRRNMVFTGVTTTNKDIIEAIKAKIDIVDIIGRYTDVIAKGSKYYFKCKIHGEDKNPSGTINSDEKLWYCFGCGKGGDVFSFVELYERVDFPKAIHILGRYVGIDTHVKPPKKMVGGIRL